MSRASAAGPLPTSHRAPQRDAHGCAATHEAALISSVHAVAAEGNARGDQNGEIERSAPSKAPARCRDSEGTKQRNKGNRGRKDGGELSGRRRRG